MRIHYLQHVAFEGPGSIAAWAQRAGHQLTATRFHEAEHLPALEAVDWLVVMGGPMSVHDERAHPWLLQEKRFIEAAIAAGKTVLGICLGAQLIAQVLGARVYPNPVKEIGWFPVERTPQATATSVGAVLPARFEAFHWHGETFDLPADAVHLARSEACAQQAFVYRERVVALQFHLETTRTGVEDLSARCAAEIHPGPFVQPAAAMRADDARFAALNRRMARLLDCLADLPA
ncbi:MAG: type 1 glutamine amidotransferase [Candidatus Binatia bacterium]